MRNFKSKTKERGRYKECLQEAGGAASTKLIAEGLCAYEPEGIDLTEQWVTFHLNHPDNKKFRQPDCRYTWVSQLQCARARSLNHLSHICTAADAKIRAEVAALGTTHLNIGLRNWGYWEDAKRSRYRSPWPKWRTLSAAALWRTGDKGAPPSRRMLAVRKQLQRKAEAPAWAPTQKQLSAGEVINVPKQDYQGKKCTLTACRIKGIKKTPPACFRDLQYPLWVVNADPFVEYDSEGFVLQWLFDVMMLGKDVIFYRDADVVHRIGRDMQRLWRMKKDKDPTTVPFYHARLPAYSCFWVSVTSNMYQCDEHCMCIGTTSRWYAQVYLLLPSVSVPLCA